MTGLQPAPEQWLPPTPVTDAEQMARAIYAACVNEELRAAGGNTTPPDRVWLATLRRFARECASVYFDNEQAS